MLKLEQKIGKTKVIHENSGEYKNMEEIKKYSIFAEQYLEPMTKYGNIKNGFSVTCCTFRGIPTVDDF